MAEVHCLAGLLNLYIGLQTPNPTLKKSNSQNQYHNYSQAEDEDEDDEEEEDFNPTFPHRLSHSSLSNLPTAILASSNEHFKRGLESKDIGKWSWNDRSRTNRLLIQNDIKRKKAFGKVLRKSEEKFWGVGKGWRVQVEEESQDDDEDEDEDESESDSEEIEFRNQNSNSKGNGKEKGKNLPKVDKKRKRTEKDSDSNSDSAESLDEGDRKLRRENDRDKREDSDDSWQTEEEVEVEEARKSSKMGIPNTEINWAEELCRVYVDLVSSILLGLVLLLDVWEERCRFSRMEKKRTNEG